MKLTSIARLAGVVLLTAGLAGCMDATLDFEVTSETEGKAVSTIVFDKAMLDMIKGMSAGATPPADGQAQIETPGTDDLCPDDAEKTEADGKVTCVETKEGTFAELELGENGDGPQITSAGPGLVRVAFPTKELAKQVDPSAAAGGEAGAAPSAEDAQTKAMMAAFFEGHFIKIIVRGAEITETNMDLSEDSASAEKTIQWMDLINGTGDFPEELYAVVKVN